MSMLNYACVFLNENSAIMLYIKSLRFFSVQSNRLIPYFPYVLIILETIYTHIYWIHCTVYTQLVSDFKVRKPQNQYG